MTSQLQTELKQQRPFESLEAEAILSILRTAAEIEYQGAEVLKPYGLTGTQYNALRILRGAGPEGLCRNEVRDRLEERGLVARSLEGGERGLVLAEIGR